MSQWVTVLNEISSNWFATCRIIPASFRIITLKLSVLQRYNRKLFQIFSSSPSISNYYSSNPHRKLTYKSYLPKMAHFLSQNLIFLPETLWHLSMSNLPSASNCIWAITHKFSAIISYWAVLLKLQANSSKPVRYLVLRSTSINIHGKLAFVRGHKDAWY